MMTEELLARLHLECPRDCTCRGVNQLERVAPPELAPGFEAYRGLDELTIRRLEGDR